MNQPRLHLDHFTAMWSRLGLSPTFAQAWHPRLIAAYSEPQRHYHDKLHLAECLGLLDDVRDEAPQPDLIELALWFHDAVYDPRAQDNEARSADLAAEALTSAAAEPCVIRRVQSLILATQKHQPDDDACTPWLLDIDLAILGSAPERFASYEQGIRSEYAWVDPELYRTRRAEILQSFLQRPQLYLTKTFAARYDEQARRNLAAAVR